MLNYYNSYNILFFKRYILGVCCLAVLCTCRQPESKTLFTLISNTKINFENKVTESNEFNVFKYRNFYNGAGVAIGDINNDGLPDVFFTANQESNRLYLNKGNFDFEDISAKAGFKEKKEWSTGVVMVDINNDGWLDIYICNAGNMLQPELRRNQLFINNHDLTFTEGAKQYGLDNDGYSTQASFFDYDMDGDLDCFIINNSPIPANLLNYANMRDLPAAQWNVADFLKGGGDHLYRNENGQFTEVTSEAGIHGGLISLGLGVTVSDINGDGYPDIYVSNDFFERDYLYINQKNGKFTDELEKRIRHTSLSSMGADIQDVNNDGYPDIFTTDMFPDSDYRLKTTTTFENYDVYRLKQDRGFFNQFTQNNLQVNNAAGKFLETSFYGGVAASDWSWGALLFDADNDGNTDIYISNGIYRDVTDQDFTDFFANEAVQQMVVNGQKDELHSITEKMPSSPIPNKFFRNAGNLSFKDMGAAWGISIPSFSNGAAYADLDNDGDLDLVVNNVNQKAALYRNNSREYNKNNYLSISLKYLPQNQFAIGSIIKLYQNNEIISREVMPSRGFQSSVDYKQVIGLGISNPDSITITWPNRKVTRLIKPEVNKLTVVDYNTVDKDEQDSSLINTNDQTNILSQLPASFDKHEEDEYVDFNFERNVPFMLSRQGPKAATADVNKDGLMDIYIGGSREHPSQLYLQTPSGFVKKEVPDFRTFSFNDITAALFFDCDGDGDIDLFAGGGGNFATAASGSFQNFIYENDGQGNFTFKKGALPVSNTNCGAVVPLDYDNDGAMDLYIGSRSVPLDYGINPRSFLLHNNGKGNFVDVTNEVAPSLVAPGMITAAVYADVDGDKKNELIIIGDWMAPLVFSFNGKGFDKKNSGLENLYGLWQSMAVDDVDKDGDMDLVLGNIGENFYLKIDSAHPAKIWIKDFDKNGVTDKIFTKTIDGNDFPVFNRREITDQIPDLKKLNLKHKDYASKKIEDLFESEIKGALVKQVNYASSCVAFNDGKGQFTVKKLPVPVQLSSVNAIKIKDVNSDGYPDIIVAGNFFDLLPQFGRIDASRGCILLNDKKGNFLPIPDSKTGLDLEGETKDIQLLKFKNSDVLLFFENNKAPLMYKINGHEN